MHKTGDYVTNGGDFSASKWLSTTNLYLDKIQNDLTSESWTAIFRALIRLQEARAQDEQADVGAPLVPRERQAFLPADPPTPPQQD